MRKIIFFAFLLLASVPISVKAENIVCFDYTKLSVIPGATYETNIKVDSKSLFSNVEFDVTTTSNFIKVTDVKINENFTNKTDDGYSLEASTPQKSGTIVATIIFKIDSSIAIGNTGSIEIIDPNLGEDDNPPKGNILTLSVNKKKSNELSKLKSDIVPIYFKKNKRNYTVEVKDDIATFDLIAIPEDPKAKVTISSQDLIARRNVITVKVNREGLKENTYNVTVIKDTTEANSIEIENNSKKDKDIYAAIKKKWVPIIAFLAGILIIDLFFLKKKNK